MFVRFDGVRWLFSWFRVCEEEEDEEPIERRIHQSDEYYQERARPPRNFSEENLSKETSKYDIDE